MVNGRQTNVIKKTFGRDYINVPQDRESTFELVLVHKRHNIIERVENVIISFYANVMSMSDIENQIK